MYLARAVGRSGGDVEKLKGNRRVFCLGLLRTAFLLSSLNAMHRKIIQKSASVKKWHVNTSAYVPR